MNVYTHLQNHVKNNSVVYKEELKWVITNYLMNLLFALQHIIYGCTYGSFYKISAESLMQSNVITSITRYIFESLVIISVHWCMQGLFFMRVMAYFSLCSALLSILRFCPSAQILPLVSS